jgi:hypothetical protein
VNRIPQMEIGILDDLMRHGVVFIQVLEWECRTSATRSARRWPVRCAPTLGEECRATQMTQLHIFFKM